MQLIRGPTLAEALGRGGLARPRALEVLTQVASALDAAHEDGLAHGWVRPEAVLIDGKWPPSPISSAQPSAGEASGGDAGTRRSS
jgi:hypothetical protein